MAHGKKIKVGNFIVKYTDIFHLKELYKWMREWLVYEGWVTRTDEDFPETFYNQNEAGEGGTEMLIFWKLKKDWNEFFTWRMDIKFHVLFLKSIEVIQDGKKFKTNDGEVELSFDCFIETDPKDKWKKHPLLNQFLDLFRDRYMKENIEKQKDYFRREAYRLQEAVKEYLNKPKSVHETEAKSWVSAPKLGVGE